MKGWIQKVNKNNYKSFINMFLNVQFPYSNNVRNHSLIALLMGVMVVFIIVFLEPYRSGMNNFPFKNIYFIGYGFLVFFCYLITFVLSKIYFDKFQNWQWAEEIFLNLIFISLVIIMANLYTELIINKKPSRVTLSNLVYWFNHIFIGFGVIMFIVVILLRRHFALNEHGTRANIVIEEKKETIVLKGTVKKETFTIESSKIVFVKSEDNYVIIYFMDGNKLNSKILRNTLKNTKTQLPFLLRTHRSYLINMLYVERLNGNSQNAKLQLKGQKITIPVSKTYHSFIKAVFLNHIC